MTPDLLARVNEARAARRAVLHWIWLDTGEQGLHEAGEAAPPTFGEAFAARLKSGRSGIVEIEGRELFVNVHVPAPRLVIVGAVHIGQALARMAELVEFDVTVIDPRTAFATRERFTGVSLIAEWPEEVDLALDPYTALAAVTHDPKIDDGPIAGALAAGCFYVGALGSRKTHGKRRDRLREQGVSDAELDRIAAPIGFDIGAATPQEIAVAVLAQIIERLRK